MHILNVYMYVWYTNIHMYVYLWMHIGMTFAIETQAQNSSRNKDFSSTFPAAVRLCRPAHSYICTYIRLYKGMCVCDYAYTKSAKCATPALQSHSCLPFTCVKLCLYLYEFLHYSLVQPFVDIFRSYAFALFQFCTQNGGFSACSLVRAYIRTYTYTCTCIYVYIFSFFNIPFCLPASHSVAEAVLCRQCCRVSQKQLLQ